MTTSRSAVALASLLLALPVAAGAADRGCVVVTDPAADVEADAVPGSAHLPDGHLDLREVRLASTGSQVVATIQVTDLFPERSGRWAVTFRWGARQLFLRAERGPVDVNAGTADGGGSRAGVVGSRGQAASAVFDEAANVVRITAPARAFGVGSLRGARLSDFRAEAREVIANVGVGDSVQQVTVSDRASSSGMRRIASC
jgi:hypothetical protein